MSRDLNHHRNRHARPEFPTIYRVSATANPQVRRTGSRLCRGPVSDVDSPKGDSAVTTSSFTYDNRTGRGPGRAVRAMTAVLPGAAHVWSQVEPYADA